MPLGVGSSHLHVICWRQLKTLKNIGKKNKLYCICFIF
nr:hypothetical protein [Bacteroides sp.]